MKLLRLCTKQSVIDLSEEELRLSIKRTARGNGDYHQIGSDQQQRTESQQTMFA